MAAMAASEMKNEMFVSKNDTSDDNIDVTMNSDEILSSPDKSINSAPDSEGYHSRNSDLDTTTRINNNDTDKLDNNTITSLLNTSNNRDTSVSETNGSDYDSGDDRMGTDDDDRKSAASPQSKASAEDNWFSTVEAKKARVENIITSMRHYPSDYHGDAPNNAERGRKRKQFHPQQHETSHHSHTKPSDAGGAFMQAPIRDLHDKLQFIHQRMYNAESENELINRAYRDNELARRSALFGGLLNGAPHQPDTKHLHPHISPTETSKLNTHAYEQFKLNNKDSESTTKSSSSKKKFKFSDDPKDIDDMCADLKRRISRAIANVVDDFNKDFTEYQKTIKEELQKAKQVQQELQNERLYDEKPPQFPFFSRPDENMMHKLSDNPLRNLVDSLNRSQIHHPLASYPPFPYYRYLPTLPTMMPPPPPPFQTHAPVPPVLPEPEQTEALSLVVSTPKKKRTKVTDTRLSPRAARALLQDGGSQDSVSDSRSFNGFHAMSPASMSPHCLPTSVAITNPSLQQSEFMRFVEDSSPVGSRSGKHSPLQADQGSPGASNVISSESARLSNGGKLSHFDSPLDMSPFYPHLPLQYTSTLTPMHLRKAKLMFFFVRYPSSSVLKTYFPDIHFNKNNTAQLVKWFSNFREFFYIQMEKYARQAIAEGVTNPADIMVSVDAEIYRVLNLHYNRNNQLEVPDKFRHVIETALREFFMAIVSGKDTEQPWKKTIYKVIQRLDEALPDFFLSPNWMELIGET